MKPLLENLDREWETPALCTFGPNNHSLRSERWRYTVYVDGSEELYDHKHDPHEWKNLASDPDFAEIINQFKNYLPTTNVEPLPGSAGSDSPSMVKETSLSEKRCATVFNN